MPIPLAYFDGMDTLPDDVMHTILCRAVCGSDETVRSVLLTSRRFSSCVLVNDRRFAEFIGAWGASKIMDFASNGHVGVVDRLVRRCGMSDINYEHMLTSAVLGGHLDMVKLVLDYSPSAAGPHNPAAMVGATVLGFVDIMNLLMTHYSSSHIDPVIVHFALKSDNTGIYEIVKNHSVAA